MLKLKILVVDDDQDTRDLIYDFVSRKGHICSTADKGCDALALLAEIGPQVVITDFVRPEMNGIGVERIIRDNYPETRVIILTENADVEMAIEAVNLGVYCLIQKPLELEKLSKPLKDICQEIHSETKVMLTSHPRGLDLSSLRSSYSILEQLQSQMENLNDQVGLFYNKRN